MPTIINPETGEIITGLIILDDAPAVEAEVNRANRRLNAPRGEMREITCRSPGCNNKKMVRVADIKRGWGKFCSRSCSKK